MRRLILVAGLSLLASRADAAGLPPWPPEAKAEAAESCKQTIRDGIASNYMSMMGVSELPPDFYGSIASSLNPRLAACDCAVGKLEQQFGYDYYNAHREDMPAKINHLMLGACAPRVPVIPEHDPEADPPSS